MKITLHPIQISTLRDFVKIAFEDDVKLLTEYHISPGTLDHCVDHTMGFIKENETFYKDDIEFYAVHSGEIPIGYTIIIRNEKEPNELYSFGINKDYRNEDMKAAWLDEVKKLTGVPFGMVLWSKNTRAIDFFERSGFIVERTSKLLDDETKTLILCLN